jgi:outer membrane protein OmpA-like peptidoglycan-associated protein
LFAFEPVNGDGSSQLVSIDQLKLNDLALNTTGLINTGKTKTVAIGAGSIARDFYSANSAGINPTGVSTIGDGAFSSRLATLDQRGVARPTGTRIDVGAFEYGEDPVVVPVETPAVVTKATIAAQKIKFAPGSSKLSSASKKKLRTLAAEIQAKGLKTVNLEGYTATLTKAAPSGKVLRIKLSKARATAVEKYLKQQFKKSGYSVTFTKSPKGAANRVKSNQTEKGRADNRRVEITIN